MLQGITFDFWGTLAQDSGEFTSPLRLGMLAHYLPGRSLAEIKAAYDHAWKRFLGELDRGLGLSPSAMVCMTLDALQTALPPPDLDAVTRGWEESILHHPPALLPGALEVLAEVRRRGLWVGLISDTGVTPGRVTREFLRRHDALRMFDVLTFSNELGISKACPQTFRQTVRAMGLEPHQVAHLGDQPQGELRGARAAGVHPLLLLESSQRRDGIPVADVTLERLVDIIDVLDHWQEALATGGIWRTSATNEHD